MKCVCGYEHYTDREIKVEEGFENHLEVSRMKSVNCYNTREFIKSESSVCINEWTTKQIIVCPECGTLKVDL